MQIFPLRKAATTLHTKVKFALQSRCIEIKYTLQSSIHFGQVYTSVKYALQSSMHLIQVSTKVKYALQSSVHSARQVWTLLFSSMKCTFDLIYCIAVLYTLFKVPCILNLKYRVHRAMQCAVCSVECSFAEHIAAVLEKPACITDTNGA